MRADEQNGVASIGERDANRIIEEQLRHRVESLEEASGSDVLFYIGPMYPMAADSAMSRSGSPSSSAITTSGFLL